MKSLNVSYFLLRHSDISPRKDISTRSKSGNFLHKSSNIISRIHIFALQLGDQNIDMIIIPLFSLLTYAFIANFFLKAMKNEVLGSLVCPKN